MKKLITIILLFFIGFNAVAKPDTTNDKHIAKQKIQKLLNSLADTLSHRQIEDEIYKLNPEPVWKNERGRWFFAFSGLFAIFSLWFLLQGIEINNGKLKQPSRISKWDGIIYGIWIIAPPLWFLYEYVWMFDDKYKMHSDYSNDIKIVQDLASKVWGAIFVLFSSILYVKYSYEREKKIEK